MTQVKIYHWRTLKYTEQHHRHLSLTIALRIDCTFVSNSLSFVNFTTSIHRSSYSWYLKISSQIRHWSIFISILMLLHTKDPFIRRIEHIQGYWQGVRWHDSESCPLGWHFPDLLVHQLISQSGNKTFLLETLIEIFVLTSSW